MVVGVPVDEIGRIRMSDAWQQVPMSDTAHWAANFVSRRIWLGLGAAYLGLGSIAWALGRTAGSDDWWLHGLWCIAGLALSLPVLGYMFRGGFRAVLVDHRIVFLAAFSLYFLFGAALLAIGPEVQVEAAQRYYPIDAAEALRVNAVNGIGFGLALLAATLARGRWLGARAAQAAAAVAGTPRVLIIVLFLLLGLLASGYVLWFDLAGNEGFVPGILRSASRFSLVAIFLAAAHGGRGEVGLRVAGAVLAGMLAIGGALQFSKTDALMPVAAFVAGSALRFGLRNVLPVGLTLLVAGYLVLGDLAIFGRAVIGYRGVASVAERWQILQDSWQATRGLGEEEQYGAWARLCYTPPQAAALNYRDAGDGGDGFRLLPWILVPRVVAQDKPEITKTGREFNAKVTGSETSSTGQGIFASGYYHGGPWGFMLASVLCGWILAQSSAISRAIIARRALLLLPLCLLGLYIAFRIDGDFVADYAGAFVFILYPILVIAFVASATGLRQRGHSLREP